MAPSSKSDANRTPPVDPVLRQSLMEREPVDIGENDGLSAQASRTNAPRTSIGSSRASSMMGSITRQRSGAGRGVNRTPRPSASSLMMQAHCEGASAPSTSRVRLFAP